MGKFWTLALIGLMLLIAACSSGSDDATTETSEVSPDSTTSTVAQAPSTTTTVPESSTTTTTTTPTTTTVALTTTTMPAGGTFDDPIPPGSWARVGNVDIAVLSIDTDVADLVVEENAFNDPPAEGNRFVMWQLAVSNAGEDVTNLLSEVSFSVVGPSAVAYDAFTDCGVVPDALDTLRDVFPGGTLVGNVCWEVAEADADDLSLLVEEFAYDGERVVFAAPEPGAVLEVEFPTPVPPDPDGPVGSRGNPYPIGETVTVGDWELSVTGVVEDATDVVMAENQFNDPPAEGRQFTMVGIEATYTGSDSDSLAFSTSFSTVGPLAVAYSGDDTCGVVPDGLDTFADVFNGGTITGNLCWSVKSEEVDGLVMYVTESLSFDDTMVFLGLK